METSQEITSQYQNLFKESETIYYLLSLIAQSSEVGPKMLTFQSQKDGPTLTSQVNISKLRICRISAELRPIDL